MPVRYDDNKVLRPDLMVSFTAPMVSELIKCSKDPVYWAETYCQIVHPIKGKHVIQFYDAQKRIVNHMMNNRFAVILASRQVGKTTCSSIYLLHQAIFNANKTFAILANKDRTAQSILHDVRVAYEGLPAWIKPGVIEYSDHAIRFDNGSIIFSSATSDDALRGESVSTLFLDEFAFVKQEICEEFWKSNYPTISTGGRIIIVSTPKGVSNKFHEIWSKAMRGENSFAPLRVDWWEIPGRDNAWKQATIKDVGVVQFAQEYGNSFLGSQHTLVNQDIIQNLTIADPVGGDGSGYSVYESVVPGAKYILGIDVAKGTSYDDSFIQVLRLMPEGKLRQVATWKRNDVDVFKFCGVVHDIARMWNEAYINVENNGLGDVVLNSLWTKDEYMNLFADKPAPDEINTGPKHRGTQFGTNANGRTKRMMTSLLKRFIEEGRVQIIDRATISELASFIDKGNGKFEADDGAMDDAVTSLGWAIYMFDSKTFQDLIADEEPVEGTELDPEVIAIRERMQRELAEKGLAMPDPEEFASDKYDEEAGLFSEFGAMEPDSYIQDQAELEMPEGQ